MSSKLKGRRKKLYHNYGKQWCAGCGIRMAYDETTIDHIRPLAKGGTDRWSNLQLMHSYCNNKKADAWTA